MKALISKEFEGSKARSRVRWFEDGERPTRYLFKLEHARVARNSVTSILDSNDVGAPIWEGSPGSDGLTTEFYLHFWNSLGPSLLHVAEQCFLHGELAQSMKESITRLILKKRGDAKHFKNWRPISLLNVDYKIISKAITAQFLVVLFFLTFHFCTIFWTISK